MIVPSRIRCPRAFALALLSLLLAFSAHAALPAGVTQGPTVEGITEYKLANGLAVLLFPGRLASPRPRSTSRIGWARRHENYGETGMAHLLEHLVFKGTPTRGNIMQELGRRGMSFNGSTSFDRTNYFQSFTASDDNLDWALAMEADRMVNSFIRRSDLDSEMTVVRNEFENMENNPQVVLLGPHARVGVPVAQLRAHRRSARAPTSRTSTSAACRRSTSCTTSPTTRC